jgi:hypothetical protein
MKIEVTKIPDREQTMDIDYNIFDYSFFRV